MNSDLVQWHGTLEKGIRGIFPGIETVVVSAGGRSYPGNESIDRLIEHMISLNASEILLDGSEGKLLVVKHDYGDLCAAAYYRDGVAPADLSRLVQLMFSGRGQRACDSAYVPASEAERLIGLWKRAIAFVLGAGFAAELVERPFRGHGRNELTPERLEEARAFISSALGDCLDLEKVNK